MPLSKIRKDLLGSLQAFRLGGSICYVFLVGVYKPVNQYPVIAWNIWRKLHPIQLCGIRIQNGHFFFSPSLLFPFSLFSLEVYSRSLPPHIACVWRASTWQISALCFLVFHCCQVLKPIRSFDVYVVFFIFIFYYIFFNSGSLAADVFLCPLTPFHLSCPFSFLPPSLL